MNDLVNNSGDLVKDLVNDTISRAAAIEAVSRGCAELRGVFGRCEENILALPPVLPSVTDIHVGGNLIYRQAAISEIMEDLENKSLHDDPATPEDYAEGYDEGIRNAAAIVLRVPSVQPTGTKTVQVDDCISRAAVVDAIEGVDWYHQNENGEMVHGANSADHQAWYKAEDIYKAIEGVPSAQPGWIPCSTALPSKYDNYLITTEDGMVVFGVYDPRERQWCRYDKIKSWWLYGIKVLAWMPLPKPWEGDANDT